MMRRSTLASFLTCALAVGVWPSTALAQSAPPRTVLLINGYARVAAPEFKDLVDPLITFERAAIDVTYAPATTLGGGLGLARRLTTRFGVLADVSFGSAKAAASARGTVPHPLYFSRARDVEGTGDATGSQMIVDVLATGFWQKGARWTILAGAGPSLVRVSQDVVTGVLVTETFPYDTVVVKGLQTDSASGTGIGVTGMLDVTRSFGTRAGLAMFARYTVASVGTGTEATAADINAGGLRIGLGLRFRWGQ
jgi:hypothetical protein